METNVNILQTSKLRKFINTDSDFIYFKLNLNTQTAPLLPATVNVTGTIFNLYVLNIR